MSDTVRDLAAEWLASRAGLGEPSETEAMDLINIGLQRAAGIARNPGPLSLAPIGGWVTASPKFDDGIKVAKAGIAAATESEIKEIPKVGSEG